MKSKQAGINISLVSVFISGVVLFLLTSFLMYQAEATKRKNIFESLAADRAEIIEETVKDNIRGLQSIGDLYASSEKVTREEFHIFTEGIIARYASIFELRWIPRIYDRERQVFEEATRQEGLSGFEIKDIGEGGHFVIAKQREEYFPVCYIESSADRTYDNNSVFGLDASQFPERRSVMKKACDEGYPMATGEIVYLGETGVEIKTASRLFLPIYRNGAPHNTLEERRNNLTGFVVLLYQIDKMIKNCFEDVSLSGIDIYLYDETAGGEKKFLCYIPDRSRKEIITPEFAEMFLTNTKDLLWSRDISVAGRKWNIICIPAPYFLAAHGIWIPWVFLFIGLVLTLILVRHLRGIFKRTIIVQGLVEQRTAELSENEERLKLANKEWLGTFNSISDFVFIVDQESRIVKVNSSFLNVLNLRREDVVGKKCYEILHKKDAPWPGCPHQKTLSDRQPHTAEVKDPGLGLPLLVTTSPIFDEKGELVGSVHIAKDISNLKKTEGELISAKEELEVEAWGLVKANEGIKMLYKELETKNKELSRLDQLKTDFVSTVSHELRTPLTIMKEGVSLVVDKVTGELNEKQEKTLAMVYANINRLAQLINDLLDISKIEAGRVELKKSLVDIANLVKEAAERWKGESDKKGQELIVSVPPEAVNIYIDSDKIIQILNNLISNAVKYTPEKGSVRVELANKKNEVELSVSDNGPGIKEEDIHRVFQKFQQFGRTAGGGAKGTGLGLAITKELIRLHEGNIWVESKVNQGTKFICALPKMGSEVVFRNYVRKGLLEAFQKGLPLSLISIYVSEFTRLQQELGLDRAHNLLREINAVIAVSLRKGTNILVRDTGEMIILLPGIDKNETSSIKERLSQAVQFYLARLKNVLPQQIAFSIGFSTYPEDAKDEEELLNGARKLGKKK